MYKTLTDIIKVQALEISVNEINLIFEIALLRY